MQAARGRGVAEHCATGAEKQLERRALGTSGLIRRRGQKPRRIAFDEIEGELADPLQLCEHADHDFGVHRVRPCT